MVGILKMHLMLFTVLSYFPVSIISPERHLAKMELFQFLYEFVSLFHLSEPTTS